jgi:predicted CoA-binding protein
LVLNNLSNEINSVLNNHKTIAVVGLSRDPTKASHRVARYLQSAGYKIIPINPFANEILGKKAYNTLLEVPEIIEIVDIFRPSEDVPLVVEEAIELKNKHGAPTVIWMQLGIVNEKAAERARKAGFTVVMNRCIMLEHQRLTT